MEENKSNANSKLPPAVEEKKDASKQPVVPSFNFVRQPPKPTGAQIKAALTPSTGKKCNCSRAQRPPS